jgi:hypothetical protein
MPLQFLLDILLDGLVGSHNGPQEQNGQPSVVVPQAAAMTAVNFTKSFGVRCVLLRTKHLVQ